MSGAQNLCIPPSSCSRTGVLGDGLPTPGTIPFTPTAVPSTPERIPSDYLGCHLLSMISSATLPMHGTTRMVSGKTPASCVLIYLLRLWPHQMYFYQRALGSIEKPRARGGVENEVGTKGQGDNHRARASSEQLDRVPCVVLSAHTMIPGTWKTASCKSNRSLETRLRK